MIDIRNATNEDLAERLEELEALADYLSEQQYELERIIEEAEESLADVDEQLYETNGEMEDIVMEQQERLDRDDEEEQLELFDD